MTDAAILGPLSSLHEMMAHLLESVPAKDAARQYHPELGSLSWYFGRSVYLETFWLRQFVGGDAELSARVEHLFTPGALSLAEQCAALPPADHLLNWAAEIRSEHLMRLANPGMMPNHPLLDNQRFLWFLLQEQAKDYERMLIVLNQRQARAIETDHRVERALSAKPLEADVQEVAQGHYRIGARDDPMAYDIELPPQAVKLSAFRIARLPVSNAQFLAFMQAGGYQEHAYWDEQAWRWLQAVAPQHPEYWRMDDGGNWYGVGVNGPADLPPDEPVSGISYYEAQAFAAWANSLGGAFSGAVLQHEYQWEVAARTGVIENLGRVQEWCANRLHEYPEYLPFPTRASAEGVLDGQHCSLKGGSLHAQRPLRRLSFREGRLPNERTAFTGARLVFPPIED